jgi:AraC family transcriptional regulator of adaptative response/methylated-DNA-[protein]-cysteine methyltransferase
MTDSQNLDFSFKSLEQALLCAMKDPILKTGQDKKLQAAWLNTPLGSMLAVADEQALCLLEFVHWSGLKREILRLRKKLQATIDLGSNAPIASIRNELKLYFEGSLTHFQTPISCHGTPFQKHVWEELTKIPYGETISYLDLAKAVGKPTASRAVAQANGSNQLAIIIPCHRVISANGKLGGYGGGLSQKKWLLEHENRQKNGVKHGFDW